MDIIEALLKVTNEHWMRSKTPLLLSSVPGALEAEGISEYKSHTGDANLKTFVKSASATGKFKVVEHPIHRAKIGLVPAGERFEFSDSNNDQARSELTRTDLEGFVRVLRTLSRDELSRLNVPASILMRLLELK